jgi:hypothetical protein
MAVVPCKVIRVLPPGVESTVVSTYSPPSHYQEPMMLRILGCFDYCCVGFFLEAFHLKLLKRKIMKAVLLLC